MKIGIFGGTLDPIHNGHLAAASEVLYHYGLDSVIFMPAGAPIFKLENDVSSKEDRYLMTALAISDCKEFEVSRMEIDRDKVTYTLDTLVELKKEYPDDELFFILGADSLNEIHTWFGFDELFNYANFIAVTRPLGIGDQQIAPVYPSETQKYIDQGKITISEIPAMAISSSDIRARIESGHPIWYQTPACVVRYIDKHQLYRTTHA
jgi:nicotinate-nucleotide adenylyltransferase